MADNSFDDYSSIPSVAFRGGAEPSDNLLSEVNAIAGYDIIGDVHGCATQLEALLDGLGYARRDTDGSYCHPARKAVFVGDLIDRGPEQLRVLQLVKGMVDADSAQMVLGNHEFNAMAYATEWPIGSGKYLRLMMIRAIRGRARTSATTGRFSSRSSVRTVPGTSSGFGHCRSGSI